MGLQISVAAVSVFMCGSLSIFRVILVFKRMMLAFARPVCIRIDGATKIKSKFSTKKIQCAFQLFQVKKNVTVSIGCGVGNSGKIRK